MAVITVNGEATELTSSMSILAFLLFRAVEPSRVVIEHNFEIIPREKWEQSQLSDGDNLEIVKFLGGG